MSRQPSLFTHVSLCPRAALFRMRARTEEKEFARDTWRLELLCGCVGRWMRKVRGGRRIAAKEGCCVCRCRYRCRLSTEEQKCHTLFFQPRLSTHVRLAAVAVSLCLRPQFLIYLFVLHSALESDFVSADAHCSAVRKQNIIEHSTTLNRTQIRIIKCA